uniref:Neural cell adhesion molecule 1 n=1 Tax=Schizaphis graminum TaxID=13262 RepID=A0A2S2NJ87_SCHGA
MASWTNSKRSFKIFTVTVLVAITGCASQTIQITPNEEEPVREERSKYGVTCYGPNLSEFQWRGPAGIISQSPQFRVHSQKLPMQRNQTGLLLVFETVKQEDVGKYFCTATGMDGRGHAISITLTVTKILEFDTPTEQITNEYTDYFIRCKVKGNSNPTFMWSYNGQTLKEKTTSGKYSVLEGGLMVRNVTHLDSGEYTCRAFETTNKSSVSGIKVIELKVRHKPVFLNHMEGDPVDLYVFQTDSVNLSCQNSAEPAANMTWTFNGKLFTNPADHYLVTFNRPEKLGSYSCTATNSLGKITRRFNLIEGFKPKMPSGLSVARVGDNFIELQVMPNDKGDELIGYRVEYVTRVVEPSGNTFESFDMMNFNTTEGPFMLVNLKPNTEYITKILARNRAGNSEYTEPIVVRTSPVIVTSGAPALFDGFLLQQLLAVIAAASFAASL